MTKNLISPPAPASRRSFLGYAALSALAVPAFAQPAPWPSRPIKLVIGYGPGGAGDATARLLAEGLQKLLKQPVVMDFKPGASGMIAADFVAKSPADGYTIHLIDDGALSIGPASRKVNTTRRHSRSSEARAACRWCCARRPAFRSTRSPNWSATSRPIRAR